jgi:hypothetical protein
MLTIPVNSTWIFRGLNGKKFAKETQIKSSVRPELVEGLAASIDCYRFNPIMVRQGL